MMNDIMNILEILQSCIIKHSIVQKDDGKEYVDRARGLKYVANHINVNVGTIKRWIELKEIPRYYVFDLYNLLGVDIDYKKFTAKDKDQFYTSKHTAAFCMNLFNDTIKEFGSNPDEYIYVEPSVGNGNFYNLFPEDRRLGIDIESDLPDAIICDYLKWKPEPDKKYLVLGNPPFGLRSNLALRFLNHSNYAEYVGFILPQIFDSEGKGSTKNRVLGLNLIKSLPIKPDFFYPDGTQVKVNVIFQIWSKHHKIDVEKKTCSSFMKVYSMSDGGSVATTRNKDMIGKCDVYLPQTCFGPDRMKLYHDFEELPKRSGYGIVFHKEKETLMNLFNETDWALVSFKSTNGAYNLRTDLINDVIIRKNYID
jgi:hypothetical protein